MEKEYTYKEALENVIGYLCNPIMQRKNPELYKSGMIIKDHLYNNYPSEKDLDKYALEYVKSIYGDDYPDFLDQEGSAFKAGYLASIV